LFILIPLLLGRSATASAAAAAAAAAYWLTSQFAIDSLRRGSASPVG
jgi:hypothetical protein